MRIDFSRLLVIFIIIFGVQWLLQLILAPLALYFSVHPIVIAAIIDFFMALLFAYINYPPMLRKYAFKDQNFHYNVLGYFTIFLLITVIQYA